MKILKLLFIAISICSSFILQGQTKLDSINSMVEEMLENNRLLTVLTGLESVECPVGITRTLGNVQYVVAVSEIRLTDNDTYECDLYLRIKIGGQASGKDVIFFGVGGVPLTQTGGLKGDISLALLAPYTFNLGKDISLTLLGAIGNNGTVGVSPTKAIIDCDGFKELALSAEIEFSETLLKPADGRDKVRSQFQTTVKDWHDLLVDISLPPFEVPGLSDWVFSVENAVIDLSETQASPSMVFPKSYSNEFPDRELKALWQGVFIRDIAVRLPQSLSASPGLSTTLRGHNLLIDRQGFSGSLGASPVFGINQGSAGGWAFSMDNLRLEFDRSSLISGRFSGQVKLPVSDSALGYDGSLSLPDHYSMVISLSDSMRFDLWKSASVKLDANSFVGLSYDNSSKQFVGSALLHGRIRLKIGQDSDLAGVEDIRFSKMQLSTVAPYFQVESFTYDKTIQIAGFPASISNISLSATGTDLKLGFRATVGLTSTEDNGFGGEMDLSIRSKLETADGKQRWVYDGVDIGEVQIKASTSAFSLHGKLGVFENDAVYGTGFYGSVDMKLEALTLTAKASAIFGKHSTYRYWYADAGATFSPGIPVFTGFEINGFSGGVAQRMRFSGAGSAHPFSRSGINYVPDSETPLLIKAGTLFRTTDGKVFSGNLGLEIAFNEHSGVRYLNLKGSGEIAGNIPVSDKLSKIGKSLDALSSPEVSASFHKQQMEESKHSGAISVTADLTMNFDKKELTGLFEAYVQTPFISGIGAGGHMGQVEVYFGSGKWFIHAGKPDVPIGLQLGIGPLSVKAKTYLMSGHDLPSMPAPPQEVTSILGNPIPDNRHSDDLQLGKGFAFGAGLNAGTGRTNLAIFYSDFQAGIGFDCMLKDLGHIRCEGSSKPVGINGWYIEGQAYAYLIGEVGLTMKIMGKHRDLNILKGSAAVLMQAKLPNPSWFAGDLALNYSVLNGMVKGRCQLSIEIGKLCEFQQHTAGALAGQELISELSPNDPQQETDVFVVPQAVFNMPIKEFRMDESSNWIRAELTEFALSENGKNIPIETPEWSEDKYLVKITGQDALPGKTEIKTRVKLKFSEKNASGNWVTVLDDNGKPYEETKETTFKTGERPKTIAMEHLKFAYPVPNQQFFLKDEHEYNFIQLKCNYGYLFTDETTVVKARLRSGSETVRLDMSWNFSGSDYRLSWPKPELKNSTFYTFEIVSLPKDGAASNSVQATYAQTTLDGAGESSAEMLTNTAGDAGSEGEFIILAYSFKTSRFNTFAEKMAQLTLKNSGASSLMSNGYIRSVVGDMTTPEGFDLSDITGNEYTRNKPLIVVRSAMNDDYYLSRIAPLLYSNYPFDGTVTYTREGDLGIVPDWAIIKDSWYTYETTGTFPWRHVLANTYYQDYSDAQTQIAASPAARIAYQNVLISGFPILPGDASYELKFAYTLPNGAVTNASVVKTFVVP